MSTEIDKEVLQQQKDDEKAGIPEKTKTKSTDTAEGIIDISKIKKVSKLKVDALDPPDVKAKKNDILNSLIDWHDKVDKKDANNNVYAFDIYKDNITEAIYSLINQGQMIVQDAMDLVTYLSDGVYKATIDMTKLYPDGIIISLTNPPPPAPPLIDPKPTVIEPPVIVTPPVIIPEPTGPPSKKPPVRT